MEVRFLMRRLRARVAAAVLVALLASMLAPDGARLRGQVRTALVAAGLLCLTPDSGTPGGDRAHPHCALCVAAGGGAPASDPITNALAVPGAGQRRHSLAARTPAPRRQPPLPPARAPPLA
ncbi:MAG: hypothetical protein R3E48_21215 [Burkholderiaceae bacterium]